jgi:predicted nucleic acid-binding Zn ribbon protein
MPLYDFACRNDACAKKDEPVEKLVKASNPTATCEVCDKEMERLPLSYRHFGWHANMSSVRFHFNYLE